MADLKNCEIIARTMLKESIESKSITEEDIVKAIKNVSLLIPMTEEEMKIVEKQLQSSLSIRLDLGIDVIRETTYHPWLSNRKAQMDFYYWNRYSMFLETDQGWNADVVETLGDVSDQILDLCGNPEEKGIWKRKGLVLGDIQSGKTSNYLALCNKAADAGYKLIVLLTGTIESLRRQTQERVDAGFVGLNSRNVLQKNPEKKYIGVGNVDSNRTAYPFTNILSDFNSSKLQAFGFNIIGMPEPVILVLKKNKSVLENLATWLSTRNTSKIGEKIDLPLLLIDDEADNASVNTNNEDKKPTAINNAIVEILKLFNRSSYVAVTATPFANIFIDPDLDRGTDEFNLFPSDFIYALSSPTNYIGANRIFGANADYGDALETIDDVVIDEPNGRYVFRSKDKSYHQVPYLPSSLKDAIKYFLLANAVMDRTQSTKSHRSMLINVSQYVNVQNEVFDLVNIYLKGLKNKIQSYSKLNYDVAIRNETIKELYKTWEEYGLSQNSGIGFKDALQYLYEAVMPIEIRLVNQKAKEKGVERLDYEPYKETGLRVIAIGGNSLSRGLTLEGLIVSYFDRNSQMYDTLMQMGRWFGYRIGYEKLFKIWMEPEAISWYEYITDATAELREEILEMKRVGLTPKDFGLKVQQNKTALFVTARSKMRATTTVEQWISLAAEVIETPRLIANYDTCLKVNLQATIAFLFQLKTAGKYWNKEYNFDNNRAVFTGVEKDIVAKYIEGFVSHPRHIPFNAKDLSEYIRQLSEFPEWTVAVIGGSGSLLEAEYFPPELRELEIRYSKRVVRRDDSCLLISGQRARVGVPGATKYGLNEKEIKDIENAYRKEGSAQTIPDKPYLRTKRAPVLLIYIMQIDKDIKSVKDENGKAKRKFDSDKASIELVNDCPIIGLGIGFPGVDGNGESKKIKYVLNRVGERDMLNFEEDTDDED
ncbi:MAG: endonuclease [Lachnospiraceae bacterium]|nr:endonuclease [Lachnospiraceae bacterium]